ncbi:MAG TPA: type I-U CRISPR-associated helicase/endonuclease Cas3, partial [Candidatus Synoicihabitans sp.]|nr:type I-U CRISPR-associated helicase/endonuclease Cas3 [Candidatus Synoicihabitans sp.]
MHTPVFQNSFVKLTGERPFPWQESLFEKFIADTIPLSANLPTGLGKTAVVAVWLCALACRPDRVPRRLAYVVNRRTVVDQTTTEVAKWRDALHDAGLHDALAKLCAVPLAEDASPLAISTLRGQFADNREWCADPARPAVIVGTVDMIGSGLLFNRYTCGFKARPHHAALLGQDVLIVHDEAHLEPAFQTLLTTIVSEQGRCRDFRPARVLDLTATSRGADSAFELGKEDENNSIIRRRLRATKRLQLHPLADEKALADKLTELALARRDSGRAVLVFVRSVELANRITAELRKQQPHTEVLTGTMRGRERDRLAEDNSTFLRFLPPPSRPKEAPAPAEGTVYLVATSAGEVGVNLSADDLVCDLSTYESMAQRFGRVNRFGEPPNDATIDLVHPESFDSDDPLDAARKR